MLKKVQVEKLLSIENDIERIKSNEGIGNIAMLERIEVLERTMETVIKIGFVLEFAYLAMVAIVLLYGVQASVPVTVLVIASALTVLHIDPRKLFERANNDYNEKEDF